METPLEWILTNSYKADMISYLAAHPEDFNEAMALAVADKQPYSWRAAWLLWSCVEENDSRIQGYVEKIIHTIPNRNDDQQRELLKILLQMDINEDFEGLLFNHCVYLWEKINKKPSVRFTAFKMMVKIAQRHPELIKEVIILGQSRYMDSLSTAANKSIQRMIKQPGR